MLHIIFTPIVFFVDQVLTVAFSNNSLALVVRFAVIKSLITFFAGFFEALNFFFWNSYAQHYERNT